MIGRFAILLLAALGGVVACTPEVRVSNTGYEGTWSRGTERAMSTIAFVRDGDGMRFRWSVRSDDDKWSVRCGWDGRCEEYVDGVKTSEYTFRTWEDEETGHVMLECTGRVFLPKELDVHYVDELVLEPDGLVMWSYSLERGGQTYEGDARPKRKFEKVSDAVADPPDDAGTRE
jgi:hypothetical protein